MCGIAGLFSYDAAGRPIDVEELVDIREAMAARGPDGAGLWVDKSGCLGLAHRRLAIIDLSSAAAQPMVSADQRFVITYNGELYNYVELRQELIQRGHRFATTSDTEVLLHLFGEFGSTMVNRLRGMYAFAIWDEHTRSLFAARDPFGIKPFYFADDGRVFRFASQVKAMVRGNGIRLSHDAAGHAGFFILGYVPEPHTLYRQIRALPAGSTLYVKAGGKPVIAPYYDPAKKIAEMEDAAVRKLRNRFSEFDKNSNFVRFRVRP